MKLVCTLANTSAALHFQFKQHGGYMEDGNNKVEQIWKLFSLQSTLAPSVYIAFWHSLLCARGAALIIIECEAFDYSHYLTRSALKDEMFLKCVSLKSCCDRAPIQCYTRNLKLSTDVLRQQHEYKWKIPEVAISRIVDLYTAVWRVSACLPSFRFHFTHREGSAGGARKSISH